MNEKTIIREAMAACGWTQETLANKLQYKSQSGIAARLRGEKSMRVDTFVKMLEVMGYEVIVKSTSPTLNKNKWVVTASDGEEK